jgi:hypothetical protein
MKFPHELCVLLLALSVAAVPSPAGEFSRTLTRENLQASGLLKLTPAELAQLEVLIDAYKRGSTEKLGDAAASRAEDTKTNSKPRSLVPDWVEALITLKRAEDTTAKKKPEPMTSRLEGEFRGWTGRTNFKLENGQVWTQSDKGDTYQYTPALSSPSVKIVPGALGTFWLEIVGVNQRVRVRPIRLE